MTQTCGHLAFRMPVRVFEQDLTLKIRFRQVICDNIGFQRKRKIMLIQRILSVSWKKNMISAFSEKKQGFECSIHCKNKLHLSGSTGFVLFFPATKQTLDFIFKRHYLSRIRL